MTELQKESVEKRWSPETKYKDVKDDFKLRMVYICSCFNLAYRCNEGDGQERCYACGNDYCAWQNGGCIFCCCCCLCCWPCFIWPHRVRQLAGVDYFDFFGSPPEQNVNVDNTVI